MKIFCMSSKLKIIKEKLDSDAKPLIVNLIKYFSYPENKGRRLHWEGEIYGFIKQIDSVKGLHNLPKRDFIFKSMWTYNRSLFSGYVEPIRHGYGESNIPYDILETAVTDYLDWLAFILSEYGIVESINLVHKELEAISDEIKDNLT